MSCWSALIARDVRQLAEIERGPEMRALIDLLTARSGQLLVANGLSNELGVSASTVNRYLVLLEEVFLIKRVPAWSRNLSNRAVATPKAAFTDSGVAANALGADARGLIRPGGAFGPLLEGFVLMELARQLTWSDELVELYHYRTKDGTEVDAVLENRQGRVVGIEVKAASTVRATDFKGLKHLADRLGDDFVAGVVLYTGTQTLPFGDRMRARPVGALWEVG
uniref:ATPase n=1 Tax=Nonomuraea gerenzanensis TaxID=93944 RepID=A0A1M4EP26_9ACTN|nr:ATPase [Nonomuraea gerenzanensis]